MKDHPAPFNHILLETIAHLLLTHLGQQQARVLDPFAGIGRVHRLTHWLPHLDTIGIEIEPEWACQSPNTLIGNALTLPFADRTFTAIVTSPTYANRMADHHNARDASPRHTYRHTLNRPLHPANSGALQWGRAYRTFHQAAWAEARRVLQPNGLFVLNIKDHIRQGQHQPVTAWHLTTLRTLGFTLLTATHVPCPGQRHGANRHLRVDHETVALLRLIC